MKSEQTRYPGTVFIAKGCDREGQRAIYVCEGNLPAAAHFRLDPCAWRKIGEVGADGKISIIQAPQEFLDAMRVYEPLKGGEEFFFLLDKPWVRKKSLFVQFPNGKAWRVSTDHFALEGTVRIAGWDDLDLKDSFDELCRAVTGDSKGLAGLATSLGNDLVSFRGCKAVSFENAFRSGTLNDSGYRIFSLEPGADRWGLKMALGAQYDLSNVFVESMLASLDSLGNPKRYGVENILPIVGSALQIRTPAYPAKCTHVRVMLDDMEILRFQAEDFSGNPLSALTTLFGRLSDLGRLEHQA